MTTPASGKDELDVIIDHFSVHNPRGQAKGTLARRALKKQLHSKVQALIAASTQQAVRKALIEELNQLRIDSEVTVRGAKYIEDRLAALAAVQARKDERGAE